MKKTLKYVLATATLVAGLGSLASCSGYKWEDDGKQYTYNTFTTVSPSNWNELTYQDDNDKQIMSYIGSAFFGYDFKFDANGMIVPGEFEVTYEAATALEDVTATYAGNEKYAVPSGEAKNYAYKITLRKDLKWDDGTPIKAADFVYTMKEQLNPLFKNYRADSFYNGSTVIHKAKDYVFQGDKGWYGADTPYVEYKEALDSQLVFNVGNTAESANFGGALCSFRGSMGFPESYGYEKVAQHLNASYGVSADVVKLQGKTFAEIKADATLKAAWDSLIGWWQTEPNEELDFFCTEYTWPEVNFEDVGLFVGDKDNELVVVLDAPLDLLKEDGSLGYKAAYNFSSLPLVKQDLYEANKVAPVEGSTLWTSTYNQSVESTASWGPYKLSSFQSGKQYVLERNTNWYGYNLEKNKDKYQTDTIVCDTIKEWNTAWQAFQKGEIDSIGIDVSIAQDYKNSSQAIFTPDDYVGSLQLQSDAEALKKREEAGVDKEILTYVDFRKAISLSINRAEYNQTCSTASKAGFGLFNSMHYYDVANGGVYRNTDEAKKVLCDVYGVDVNDYASLDEAHAAITGYDLELARECYKNAYNAALADGVISATDKVVLTFGTGAITESTTRAYNFLSNAIKEAVKGTPLEGRVETEFEDHQSAWADDFRAGAYDVCTGGFTGAAWDPGYFLLAYLSPDYMYSTAWRTDVETLTYTVKGVGENGADVEETMTLLEWYDCLNGAPNAKYNWAEGAVSHEARLGIIAALEKVILSVYYTVPIQNSFSASLISYKWDYVTRDYNTFMGYGGIEYLRYAYTDAEWADYCANNTLDYKA